MATSQWSTSDGLEALTARGLAMAGYRDTAKLITAVRGRPLLWDPQQPGYKDKVLMGEAWVSVCRALAPEYDNMTEVEQTVFENGVHGRWRGVRDSYMKDYRKQRSRIKLGATRPRRYIYSDQLSFLDKIIGNKTTADKPSLAKETQREEDTVQEEEEVKKETPQISAAQIVIRRAVNRIKKARVRRNPSSDSIRQQTRSHNGVTANTSSLAKETKDEEGQDDLPDIASSLQVVLHSEPTVNGATDTSLVKKTDEEKLAEEDISHNGTISEPLPHSGPTENGTTDKAQDDDVKVVRKGKSHNLKFKPSPPPPPPRPGSTKRKRMSLEERMVKFVEESVRREDEDKDFFMSMLPAVRSLNEEQKMDFRIQVIRALQNVKAGHQGSFA